MKKFFPIAIVAAMCLAAFASPSNAGRIRDFFFGPQQSTAIQASCADGSCAINLNLTPKTVVIPTAIPTTVKTVIEVGKKKSPMPAIQHPVVPEKTAPTTPVEGRWEVPAQAATTSVEVTAREGVFTKVRARVVNRPHLFARAARGCS